MWGLPSFLMEVLTAAGFPLSTASVTSCKRAIDESQQTTDLCDSNPERCRAWPQKVPLDPSLMVKPHRSTEAALTPICPLLVRFPGSRA